MSVRLAHSVVPAYDKHDSAEFLARILDIPIGAEPEGPFVPLRLDDGIKLLYLNSDDFRWHHYAFLISDQEFDAAFARITGQGLDYYANPVDRKGSRQLVSFTETGGRGVYFNDPNGHIMELMTEPVTPGWEWRTDHTI